MSRYNQLLSTGGNISSFRLRAQSELQPQECLSVGGRAGKIEKLKVISNKEYPEIEGCSQTVPVWRQINIWNQWLLHDGLLFVGHHIYIYCELA
jgi:hypothetical protein